MDNLLKNNTKKHLCFGHFIGVFFFIMEQIHLAFEYSTCFLALEQGTGSFSISIW